MSKPITVTEGICFAFPDVCLTPAAPSPIPLPYPNTGQLSDATGTASTVLVNGKSVVTSNSKISSTTGDEAGSNGGIKSGTIQGEVKFTSSSNSVKAEDGGIVRMGDTTDQNNGNAVGTVLGGNPSVLVGD